MEPIVSVKDLVKRYGSAVALDHFTLEIAPGEIFGLLGPNGSGKTTAVNCILQLLTYDRGEICLFGQTYDADALRPETAHRHRAAEYRGVRRAERAAEHRLLLQLVCFRCGRAQAVGEACHRIRRA